MNELIKLCYRMIGGFFLFFITFPLAIAGFALVLAGTAVLAASIVPLVNPELLAGSVVATTGIQMDSPVLVFLILLMVGLILIGTGGLLFVGAVVAVKIALYFDRALARAIDGPVRPARYPEELRTYNDGYHG